MDVNKIETLLQEKLEEIVLSLGYELAQVEYKKEEGFNNLTLFIYSKNGITFEDCQKVSSAVDLPLEELNILGEEPYFLNVSSLGLDRPLKIKRDFERVVDKEIEVSLKLPSEVKIKGVLKEVKEDALVLKKGKKQEEISLENIKLAMQVIKF